MPSRPLSVFAASASPPGNRDLDLDVAAPPPVAAATSAMASRIMRRGTGLIAGSPGGSGRPGRVTVPTPSPGAKGDAAARRAGAHGGEDQRAVGHVGIVAGILDDAGGRGVCVPPRQPPARSRALAARQRHLDRIGKVAGHAAPEKAALAAAVAQAAGGPAAAQRAILPAP